MCTLDVQRIYRSLPFPMFYELFSHKNHRVVFHLRFWFLLLRRIAFVLLHSCLVSFSGVLGDLWWWESNECSHGRESDFDSAVIVCRTEAEGQCWISHGKVFFARNWQDAGPSSSQKPKTWTLPFTIAGRGSSECTCRLQFKRWCFKLRGNKKWEKRKFIWKMGC